MVREYDSFNERVQVTERRFGEWAQRMTSQYEYALDHLKTQSGGNDGDGFVYSTSHLAVDFIYIILLGLAYVGAFYYFEPMKEMGGQNDKYKFEIKRANEMKERLSDVKGIDEIKNEIDDLIK